MGTDDHIQRAASHLLIDAVLFLGCRETVQYCQTDTETFHPFLEILIMLLREDRRRTKDECLIAGHDAFEDSSHRDFRLAKAHISAKEHIHRHRFLHGFFDGVDRQQLICRFHIREGVFEFTLLSRIWGKSDPLRDLTLRIDCKQLLCQFLDGLFGLRPRLRPRIASHVMELRRFPFRADIFFQRRYLFDRKIELVISRILDRDIIPVNTGKLDGTDPEVLADAMRGLHDIVAGIQI